MEPTYSSTEVLEKSDGNKTLGELQIGVGPQDLIYYLLEGCEEEGGWVEEQLRQVGHSLGPQLKRVAR